MGEWKEYYDSGELKVEESFEKGKLEGNWKEYYKDSKLKCEGFYSHGLKEGEWKYYNHAGEVDHKKTFRLGKEVK